MKNHDLKEHLDHRTLRSVTMVDHDTFVWDFGPITIRTTDFFTLDTRVGRDRLADYAARGGILTKKEITAYLRNWRSLRAGVILARCDD
jgi:hypothetical protein